MKTRWIVGLLITIGLVISVRAQENRGALSAGGRMASLPDQLPSGKNLPPAQLQTTPGSSDAQAYPQQMEAVFQAMTADLGQIMQAVHGGTLSRADAEYLTVEQYYVGLMRFQLLRTLYQNAQAAGLREANPEAKEALETSGNAVLVTPPASAPDVSPQIAGYLNLTPEQVAAMQAQIGKDRRQVQPLLEQLEENRRQLISATRNGKWNADEVQNLAAEQARILQRLIVANAELKTELYRMLTSDQQEKVDELWRQQLTTIKAAFPEW